MIGDLKDTNYDMEPMPVQLRGISDVLMRAKEIHELIARRAYAIYEGRGHIEGHDKEDWLQAEFEEVGTLFTGFMELNGELSVDVGVTERELPELQVCIEPWRLIVSGKRKVLDGRIAQDHPDERKRPVEIFQVLDFPVQVEPSGAKATFANGLLEFRIPTVGKREKSVAAKAA